MVEYGKSSYWDKRYEKEPGKTFDWLGDYETVRVLINEHVILPMYISQQNTSGTEESKESKEEKKDHG